MNESELNGESHNGPETGPNATSQTKHAAATIGEKVKATASGAMQAAKQEMSDMQGDVSSRVTESSRSAASGLTQLANKLEEAKPELDQTLVGPVVNQAERSLRAAANYLQDRKPESYISDFTAFARHNPGVAMGGAIVLGFVLSHAAKVASKPAVS